MWGGTWYHSLGENKITNQCLVVNAMNAMVNAIKMGEMGQKSKIGFFAFIRRCSH